MNNRKYKIVVGSRSFLEEKIKQLLLPDNSALEFIKLIKMGDQNHEFPKLPIIIISNKDYHGITEQAMERLGAIIDAMTADDAEIYLHNPPISFYTYLSNLDLVSQPEVFEEQYTNLMEVDNFSDNIIQIKRNIIGQNNAVKEISKSLLYLSKVKRKKPYVIMLYGSSSLGKTQLVREIAAKFYKNKFFEKHLSMFQNNAYADYFFGEQATSKSLGYELLERNSNLLFFDELDKCPAGFYSAFYTLFDNTLFEDKSYRVDISNTLIILTSNYKNINEMQKELGAPIFYRIDKLIKFNDFSVEDIYFIVQKELNDRESEYSAYLSKNEIYDRVSLQIHAKGENARTIKAKVQSVIEELLFDKYLK